ncbi:MAG TPA: serine/threonine-protein kinase, partial [Candidatus Eisenbacteria bacterium]|nr:serine/threonine-protein kinase [Candidatus Eisenbacteria bacterium]
MSDVRETTEKLAQQVADGEPSDWGLALGSTDDHRTRRVIESLRLIEHVARAHRDMPSEPRELRHWGHLELRESLGEGGFGEVFRAWDPHLEREVALKLIEPPGDAAEPTSRVVDEGRLLARVRHPNVITVFGAEVRDDRVGLWMELVRGRSLEQLLKEHGAYGARETALIGIDLCRALAAVHRVGVVHRDIKAQNVMREEGGRIVLMDFGAGLDLRREAGSKAGLTGTPLYMAPEQFLDQPATQRSDIYSLGVLLYRLVTGTFPIKAGTWDELALRHVQQERRLLRDERPDLPEGFVSVIERAMAWDPADRFATAGQMEQALAQAIGMGNVPVPADVVPHTPVVAATRPSRRWVIAAASVAVLLATAVIIGVRNAGRGTGTRTAAVPTEPSVPAGPAAPPPTGSATSSADR